MSQPTPKLFQPFQIGQMQLQHRVAMAPLTRVRSTRFHDPQPIMQEYYAQRASTPGTFIVSEATLISPKSGGFPHYPGIFSEKQIEEWRKIVDAVHSKGSYIYMQLIPTGRAADLSHLQAIDPTFELVSASDIPLSDSPNIPRALTKTEISEYLDMFATATSNAVHKAGFDGVEIHGANGYLVDQFLQDITNKRTDEYGGSVKNRCRFALEVVNKIGETVGFNRTGLRLSPWSEYLEMGMEDPKPTFGYLVQKLKEQHPDLAYVHIIEPRIKGNITVDEPSHSGASNDFIREIWAPKPLISSGAYTREQAIEVAEKHETEVIAFGRLFLANPDLPKRLLRGIPLNRYDRSTFYLHGETTERDYTDYPFSE
ncbi:nadh:flavin oxidoreductase nadh oxidase [Moniliophthora roreri MCA 2997]|uniref:Nadh:flavin oxidoreductase nadh oxidase n=1 Tax=Moniliophthora roreri (strain MCA 2997) TaxID=1381753 RepID=V2WTS4_MONRO|nr:nadh:flavin oxidoreductase nadh oxidase [Moniliophthora roreri MCA 2997]